MKRLYKLLVIVVLSENAYYRGLVISSVSRTIVLFYSRKAKLYAASPSRPCVRCQEGARLERCRASEGTPLSPPLVYRGPRPQPPKNAVRGFRRRNPGFTILGLSTGPQPHGLRGLHLTVQFLALEKLRVDGWAGGCLSSSICHKNRSFWKE